MFGSWHCYYVLYLYIDWSSRGLLNIEYVQILVNHQRMFALHPHNHKRRKGILETRAGLAVLRTYVENQAMLEPVPLYCTSTCKYNKEQGSEDCFWTHMLTFLCNYYQFFSFLLSKWKRNRIKLCYNRLEFVKETQFVSVSNTERRTKQPRS